MAAAAAVVVASVAAWGGSTAATAGASPAPAAPDTVVSVPDPGVTLAIPHDGRLRGDGFAGQVLGVADGTVDVGAGLAAQGGQRLWVFQLRFTVDVDADGTPVDPITAAMVAGGDRYPFTVPVPTPADPNATSVDTGTLTFVASIPATVPDVATEVSAFGYPQDFSLTRMTREGVQPTVLYRDPAGPQTVQSLTAQTTLAAPTADTVVLGGNVAIDTLTLTVAADQATLSWFPPNDISQLPATAGSAWLYLDLSQTSAVTDSDCPSDCPTLSFTSSMRPGQVTLTVPGAPPRPSTLLPGTSTSATDGTILQGVYAWQVPAALTAATVTVTPGTVTIDETNGGLIPEDLFPVTVPGAATIPVDFPPVGLYSAPGAASDTPAVFTTPAPVPTPQTSPTTHGSHEPGHRASSATWVGVALVAVAAAAGALIIARRRRSRARTAAPSPVAPAGPAPPVFPSDRGAGWPAPPVGFPTPPTGPNHQTANPDRNVDRDVDQSVDRAAHNPARAVPHDRPTGRRDEGFVAPVVPEPAGLMVRVLGADGVSGWAEPPALSVGPVTEIAVYLACHPGRPISTEAIRDALGAGSDTQIAERTAHTCMTRLRAATKGTLSGGRPGYRLGEVTCDLVALDAHLAAAATAGTAAEQVEHLTAGLSWVTGPPFTGVALGYRWVDRDNLRSHADQQIQTAVTRLAELALANGNLGMARWAAHRGLLVDPTGLTYNDLALRAATAGANRLALAKEWAATVGRYRSQGQEPDPVLVDRYPPP